MTEGDLVAIYDGDGSLWRARLARWTPEMHARHEAIAGRLFRAGWNADAASYLAYLGIVESEHPEAHLVHVE